MNWRLVILIVGSMLIAMCLTSCSEKTRCARYVKKHPACFSADTVWRVDTIKGFTHDTTFIGDTLSSVDTFTFIKDNIVVKTVVKWNERTVYQQTTKRDTVFKSFNVYTDKPVFVDKAVLPWWAKWIGIALTTIIILLAVGRVRSKA